ncbi:damage-control phosphatase ARMT1 family protein [Actinoplanes sp. NPDC051859]|uniref:damage-control phosphatase ARMT1 family protein n=1 Tax=Actinoplanes sp. NPDC051859 TaxID=3363909 RepID=UPI0037BDDDC7
MTTPLLPTGPGAARTPGITTEPDVAPLIFGEPGSFARGVMRERHPALIERIRAAHPYGPAQHHALDALKVEAVGAVMRPLDSDAPDSATWAVWGADHFGQPWSQAPFLWAESYFYRRLLDAVDFYTPGPWYWVDPFAHLKNAELHDPTLEPELAALEHLHDLPPEKRTEALLLAALWGNRADLGFRIGVEAASGKHKDAAGLIADDTTAVLALLHSGPQRITVIADNAGRELLADLILIDHLLEQDDRTVVEVHLKPSPYYVSDATTTDLTACLRRLASTPGAAADIAARLWTAMRQGRLDVRTHWFYSAPYSFHRAPTDLTKMLGMASLVLLKGDLNYRRLVGDCMWPATTPFPAAAGYFPAPVAALRTLKSEVVVGLSSETVRTLDADDAWRTSGTCGTVQFLAASS